MFLDILLVSIYHAINSRTLFEVWLDFVSHCLEQEVHRFHFRTQHITSTNERATLEEEFPLLSLILQVMPHTSSLAVKALDLIGTFV